MSVPEGSDSDEDTLLVEQLKESAVEIEEIEEEEIYCSPEVACNRVDDPAVPKIKESSKTTNYTASTDDLPSTDIDAHIPSKVTTCFNKLSYTYH